MVCREKRGPIGRLRIGAVGIVGVLVTFDVLGTSTTGSTVASAEVPMWLSRLGGVDLISMSSSSAGPGSGLRGIRNACEEAASESEFWTEVCGASCSIDAGTVTAFSGSGCICV